MNTAFLEYSDTQHRYFVNGRERMSVTQILDKAGLISPFCKDEEARFRGSKVHEYCALDDATRLDLRKVPVDLRGYLRAWRRYREESGFEPMLTETRVDCDEFGYSGRFDRIGFFPKEPLAAVLDIKTSKTGIVPDYARLQLSAYAYAFDPKRVFARVAVALKPDGTYNSVIYPQWRYYTDRAEWMILVRKVQEQNNVSSNN